MRVENRPDLRLRREGPAPGPSMVLILRTIRDQHVLWIRLRIPGLLIIIIQGLRSTTGPCPLHPRLWLTTGPCPLSIIPDVMRKTLRTIWGRLMCPGERLTWQLPFLIKQKEGPLLSSSRQLVQHLRMTRQVWWARQRLPTQLQVTTRQWLPTRQSVTTLQGWPTRQQWMSQPGLPTWQGGADPAGQCYSSDDFSKVADSSSARMWSRAFFWGWGCDFSSIALRD